LLVKRKNSKDLIYNSENGIPIGWSDDEEFFTNTIDLQDGDRIVLYTDGITEARNSSDKMYGQERFYNLIKDNHHVPPDEFSQLVISEIREWTDHNRVGF
jgi:serine phosphatase RsbU (regulator of sigma subunit)